MATDPCRMESPARRAPRRLISLTGVLALGLAVLVPASAAADNAAPDQEKHPYQPGRTTLVEVPIADEAEASDLAALGLDEVSLVDNGVEVMLHDATDAKQLSGAGFTWDVVVADVAAENRKARAAEAAAEAAAKADPSQRSGLPTGRVSYRTLPEINAELAALARANPDTVKLLTLPRRSLLGTPIYGVEVTHDVATEDGKPVFLLTGLTHSREWPTPELTMEFIHDLVNNDGSDARITSLLDRGRMIAVPVVNPDGYEMSRSLTIEQKRKNCRVTDGVVPTRAECADPSAASLGVDLNRNYNAFWGGPGAGANTTDSNYRGGAPASEPEIANMIDLLDSKQVTLTISNHTPDARVLRVPSAPNEPVPAEAELYQQLAELFGGIMDWPAGPWPEVYYDASGTAEQTAFYTTGTFAFTFENTPGHGGNDRFHPPYPSVIDQYLGTGEYEGSTAREAYLTAYEKTVDTSLHSVVAGTAKPGTQLRLSKDVGLTTSPVTMAGEALPVALPVTNHVRTTMTVPRDGRFQWHVNPSDRPSQVFSANIRESWQLSCRRGNGAWKDAGDVRVVRGQTVTLGRGDLPAAC